MSQVPPVARVLAGAAGWFLRPPGELAPAPAAARRPLAGGVAVLAERPGALALGASVALALAGPGIALVACWPVEDRVCPGAPATPAARRLAGSLAARGIEARPTGRIVAAGLPADEVAAVDALRRAEVAAADAARVVVLAGPRGEAWDGVLLCADAVLVHGSDPDTVAVAVSRLSAQGAAAHPLAPAAPRPVRALAAAGLALPGTLRPLRLALTELAR